MDFATNQSDHSLDIKVDTTPPTIDGTLSGALGRADWYITSVQAAASANDSTSGIASIEYR